MKPGQLDNYILAFEHYHQKAGWGVDDASTHAVQKRAHQRPAPLSIGENVTVFVVS
jgi:hypothetical protein